MAGEDPGHLALIRTLRCAIGRDCYGNIQAHHSTHGRGMSQKTHDHSVIPLCLKHHAEFHGATGRFKGWKKAERNGWQDAMVSVYRPKATSSDDVF